MIKTAALCAAAAMLAPAAFGSSLSLGPRALQALVSQQLFTHAGKWYLSEDEDACHTYLESPHTHLQAARLVLVAHLTSRLGQSIGGSCAGANFASSVTLSGRLHGSGSKLFFDDIRIDRVEDEATRNALQMALQLAPQMVPRVVGIDLAELVRKQPVAAGGITAHLEQFHIANITVGTEAVMVQFDLVLTTP